MSLSHSAMGVTPLVYLDFDSEADGTDHVYTAS